MSVIVALFTSALTAEGSKAGPARGSGFEAGLTGSGADEGSGPTGPGSGDPEGPPAQAAATSSIAMRTAAMGDLRMGPFYSGLKEMSKALVGRGLFLLNDIAFRCMMPDKPSSSSD